MAIFPGPIIPEESIESKIDHIMLYIGRKVTLVSKEGVENRWHVLWMFSFTKHQISKKKTRLFLRKIGVFTIKSAYFVKNVLSKWQSYIRWLSKYVAKFICSKNYITNLNTEKKWWIEISTWYPEWLKAGLVSFSIRKLLQMVTTEWRFRLTINISQQLKLLWTRLNVR